MTAKDRAEKMLDAVKSYVARKLGDVVQSVDKKIDELSTKLKEMDSLVNSIPAGKDGRDGVDGKSVTLSDVQPVIISEIEKRVAEIPVPKDGADGAPGRDGINGKDADPEQIAEAVDSAVQKAVAAIPIPKDGRDGKDANPDLINAAVLVAVENAKKSLVQKIDTAIAAIPAPKDGAPGRDGDIGPAGERGADGKSVTVADVMPMLEAAFEASFAKWALEVERRAMDLFQKTADSMPVPKDGKDGFNLEDLSAEHDGDGNVILRFERGELKKEFPIRLGRFKDKGVYRDGEKYVEGDGVTYGGSFWLAQKDSPEGKPDSGNGSWRLAVKKGRDGKDGGGAAVIHRDGPVRLK